MQKLHSKSQTGKYVEIELYLTPTQYLHKIYGKYQVKYSLTHVRNSMSFFTVNIKQWPSVGCKEWQFICLIILSISSFRITGYCTCWCSLTAINGPAFDSNYISLSYAVCKAADLNNSCFRPANPVLRAKSRE
jgi:hypothetical protein